MKKIKAFLRRKDIIFSAKRYFIDAMGAMAQGLFCTLLVGTILNTIGQQFHIGFLNAVIVTIGKGDGAVNYTIGGLCSAMVGPGMAVAIARARNAPPNHDKSAHRRGRPHAAEQHQRCAGVERL